MNDLINLVLMPFVWGFHWLSQTFIRADAAGIFVALFAAGAAIRLFVRPLIGIARKQAGDD